MIRVERHDGWAELILDRPDKRNALVPSMLVELIDAAETLDDDQSVRAVLLRGEGRVFCAGFDLAACRDNAGALADLLKGLSDAVRTLRRLSQPVIVAAHGAAIAGGCALLGGGDIIIANKDAKLGYPVVSLGISPAVSAPTLRLLTSPGSCGPLMLDPQLISGERAVQLGLAHRCVDLPEDVIAQGQIEAQKLAAKPPYAMQKTKQWLNAVEGSNDDGRFDLALRASMQLVGGDEEQRLLERFWKRTNES